jgi:shikimate kinase
MAVLGVGTANGSCSLLHAAGLGYGASLALDLPVKVRLLDK